MLYANLDNKKIKCYFDRVWYSIVLCLGAHYYLRTTLPKIPAIASALYLKSM